MDRHFRVYMCSRACTYIFCVSIYGFPSECSSRVASLMAGERSGSVLLCVAGQRDPVTFSGSCFRSAPSLLRCGIDVSSIEGGLQGFLSSALQSEQLLSDWEIVESWYSASLCRAFCLATIGARVKALGSWHQSSNTCAVNRMPRCLRDRTPCSCDV